jgi:hypothetical protein
MDCPGCPTRWEVAQRGWGYWEPVPRSPLRCDRALPCLQSPTRAECHHQLPSEQRYRALSATRSPWPRDKLSVLVPLAGAHFGRLSPTIAANRQRGPAKPGTIAHGADSQGGVLGGDRHSPQQPQGRSPHRLSCGSDRPSGGWPQEGRSDRPHRPPDRWHRSNTTIARRDRLPTTPQTRANVESKWAIVLLLTLKPFLTHHPAQTKGE